MRQNQKKKNQKFPGTVRQFDRLDVIIDYWAERMK